MTWDPRPPEADPDKKPEPEVGLSHATLSAVFEPKSFCRQPLTLRHKLKFAI